MTPADKVNEIYGYLLSGLTIDEMRKASGLPRNLVIRILSVIESLDKLRRRSKKTQLQD